MEFNTTTQKEWDEYCNRICECGHRQGEHSEYGCHHELETPRNDGKCIDDKFCDCEEFILVLGGES